VHYEPQCIWDLKATLGEGPIWLSSERCVWFVDIKEQRLHRYDTATAQSRSWKAPAQPGFIAPIRGSDTFVVGLQSGLHRFDPERSAFTLITAVEPERPGNRLNDGSVDAAGRIWFGSMDDGERETSGALYCFTQGRALKRMDTGYCITNGPCVTPDGHTLYHTCTTTRTVYAFDICPGETLANKRVFLRFEASQGHPDGSIVDAEGCLWIGLWGAWAMQRYSPDGEPLERIELPCANVTKGVLGGDDLRTLYITTASKGLSDEQRAEQPLAGSLFAARVDVPGQPQRFAALD
jgi:xylono-1,5-lactonase